MDPCTDLRLRAPSVTAAGSYPGVLTKGVLMCTLRLLTGKASTQKKLAWLRYRGRGGRLAVLGESAPGTCNTTATRLRLGLSPGPGGQVKVTGTQWPGQTCKVRSGQVPDRPSQPSNGPSCLASVRALRGSAVAFIIEIPVAAPDDMSRNHAHPAA